MVSCKNCRLFYTIHELSVSDQFITVYENDDKSGPPRLYGHVVSDFGVRMCQHPDCFTTRRELTPVDGFKNIQERVAGQAQFNKYNDCTRFEKQRWWRRLFN